MSDNDIFGNNAETESTENKTEAAPDAVSAADAVDDIPSFEEIRKQEARALEIITSETIVTIEGLGLVAIGPITPAIRQRANKIYQNKFINAIKGGMHTEQYMIDILKKAGEIPADFEARKRELQGAAVLLQMKLQRETTPEGREAIRKEMIAINEAAAELSGSNQERIGATAGSEANEWKYAYLISELCTKDGEKIPGLENMDAVVNACTPNVTGWKFQLVIAINSKMEGLGESFFAELPVPSIGAEDTPSQES